MDLGSGIAWKDHKCSLCLLFLLLFIFFTSLISFSILVPISKINFNNEVNGDEFRKTSPLTTCPSRVNMKHYVPIADCHPEDKVTRTKCSSRGCCWNDNYKSLDHNPWDDIDPMKQVKKNVSEPFCYFPPLYQGYRQVGAAVKIDNKMLIKLKRNQVASGFRNDVNELNVVIDFVDENKFRIRVLDANQERWMVQEPVLNMTTEELVGKRPLYDVSIENEGTTTATVLVIERIKPKRRTLFKINLNTLIYSDQFIQMSLTNFPSNYISGLGEHYFDYRKQLSKYSRLTFKNSDRGKPEHGHGNDGKPGYGSQPFYYMTEDGSSKTTTTRVDTNQDYNDYSSHGVLFNNNNLMDIILSPDQITFRPIGGVIDMIIYLGPKSSDVISQHLSVIGKPHLPPFWSLGFGLSKFGYNNLDETKELIARNLDANIPLDVVWHDIDILDQFRDFTYDDVKFAGLPEWIKDIRDKSNLKYVPIFDPTIEGSSQDNYLPFIEGNQFNVWVKDYNDKVIVGKVWNVNTSYFPDFTHPNATEWWSRQFKRYHELLHFDGAWIDMNEPSNFCLNPKECECPEGHDLENPQYVPGDGLFWEYLQMKTLCLSSRHYLSTHYDLHNMYGFYEAKSTWEAMMSILPGKRPFILSRATTTGQGIYSSHWTGDTFSTFESLQKSISQIFDFNMFGIPLVGADICGFIGNATSDLCSRWSSLGSFYPFSRNHNIIGAMDQDPAFWGKDSEVFKAAINNLRRRYQLLPYLYTLFYENTVFGSTVFRHLSIEFTTDYPNCYNTLQAERQFLWGSSLLFVPIVEEETTSVEAYFPPGKWYQFHDFDGKLMYQVAADGKSGQFVNLTLKLDEIAIYVRGGKIIPFFTDYAQTTTDIRIKPLTLLAAIDSSGSADGVMFWDDGETFDTIKMGKYSLIEFSVNGNKFTSIPKMNEFERLISDTDEFKVNKIIVTGLSLSEVTKCLLNDKVDVSCETMSHYLVINLDQKLDLNQKFFVSWS